MCPMFIMQAITTFYLLYEAFNKLVKCFLFLFRKLVEKLIYDPAHIFPGYYQAFCGS
jgi:hypothetical protein